MHCAHPDAALVALGYEVAAGRVRAQPMSAAHPGNGARPKMIDAPEISPDLWWRIQDAATETDIWSAPVIRLKGTGNEKAIDLIGLRFVADHVRHVADAHAFSPPKEPKPKNNGGISCRAHGVVVAKLTIELLGRRREHVLGLTGISLKGRVQELYKKEERRGLSEQNAARVANGVLDAVQAHLLPSSEHSEHD